MPVSGRQNKEKEQQVIISTNQQIRTRDFKKVATVKKVKNKTTIKNVAGGETYYYKVKAYAKAGKKSNASSEYSNVAEA